MARTTGVAEKTLATAAAVVAVAALSAFYFVDVAASCHGCKSPTRERSWRPRNHSMSHHRRPAFMSESTTEAQVADQGIPNTHPASNEVLTEQRPFFYLQNPTYYFVFVGDSDLLRETAKQITSHPTPVYRNSASSSGTTGPAGLHPIMSESKLETYQFISNPIPIIQNSQTELSNQPLSKIMPQTPSSALPVDSTDAIDPSPITQSVVSIVQSTEKLESNPIPTTRRSTSTVESTNKPELAPAQTTETSTIKVESTTVSESSTTVPSRNSAQTVASTEPISSTMSEQEISNPTILTTDRSDLSTGPIPPTAPSDTLHESTEIIAPQPMPPYQSYCLSCLCHAATGCNTTYGCQNGYCGPFKISRIYWKEAGKVTVPSDDPERPGAYQDCAQNFYCAASTVISYMKKLAQDCNDDDEINCDDLIMVHYNGGYRCQKPLSRDDEAKEYEARYLTCKTQALNPSEAIEARKAER